jgi:hypothetical protein
LIQLPPERQQRTKLQQKTALVAIKLVHTAIWAFFAACILALPFTAWLRRFDWAILLTVLVLFECGILAFNRGRCPLTDLAAQFTSEQSATSDIYLPAWVAQHNKALFGTLFLLFEVLVLWRWLN